MCGPGARTRLLCHLRFQGGLQQPQGRLWHRFRTGRHARSPRRVVCAETRDLHVEPPDVGTAARPPIIRPRTGCLGGAAAIDDGRRLRYPLIIAGTLRVAPAQVVHAFARDKLHEELALAELELQDARIEQIDVNRVLGFHSTVLASPAGFEPAVSALKGQRVGPATPWGPDVYLRRLRIYGMLAGFAGVRRGSPIVRKTCSSRCTCLSVSRR